MYLGVYLCCIRMRIEGNTYVPSMLPYVASIACTMTPHYNSSNVKTYSKAMPLQRTSSGPFGLLDC